MTLIKVTHATLKSTVYLVKDLIGGWYHSPSLNATHIVLSGGAVFPALETVDEITARISGQTPMKTVQEGQRITPKKGNKEGSK